jgi:hypothetical protein
MALSLGISPLARLVEAIANHPEREDDRRDGEPPRLQRSPGLDRDSDVERACAPLAEIARKQVRVRC